MQRYNFFSFGRFFFFLEQISVFGHVLHSQIPDLYVYMRDKRGYDALDEYICEDVLMLRGEEGAKLEEIVSECAARVHHALLHQRIEPGTEEAFAAYVACLRQMYLFGTSMQLHRMGYHMTRVR